MSRILAIDYGTKRCGVAVTDPGQLIASPLETVASHELMNFLRDYIPREGVELLVVGKPRQLDNQESGSMKLIRFFVAAFRKQFPSIPVEWVDERFTSSLALDAMIEGGLKKKDRRDKSRLDRISASLILQTFLERRSNLK